MKQGRFPCGRMSGVQSGLEPLGYPHCLQCCLQWYLQVPALILGYSIFGRTHIWISLVAHYWISLVALITGFLGPHSQETGFQ